MSDNPDKITLSNFYLKNKHFCEFIRTKMEKYVERTTGWNCSGMETKLFFSLHMEVYFGKSVYMKYLVVHAKPKIPRLVQYRQTIVCGKMNLVYLTLLLPVIHFPLKLLITSPHLRLLTYYSKRRIKAAIVWFKQELIIVSSLSNTDIFLLIRPPIQMFYLFLTSICSHVTVN